MDNKRKKILLRWLKRMVLFYAVIGIILFSLQDYLLFHPTVIERNIPWHFDVPFEEVDLPFTTTDTINMVKFFPKDTVRRGVVLFFHGNKQNIGRYARFAANFTRHGYEVWMEDYPGYGKSIGARSEEILYRQAELIHQLAKEKYNSDSIVLYGKSLGTGIAAYLAAHAAAKRLILETPYYSVPDLFSCYAPMYPSKTMAVYQIPTYKYLKQVQYPITIFHGTDDGVIPYRCAKKLQTVIKKSDEYITIDGGNHFNLNDYALFHQKLDSLLLVK